MAVRKVTKTSISCKRQNWLLFPTPVWTGLVFSCGLNGIGWPSDFSLDDLAVLHWSLILHQVILGLLSRQSQRWGEQDLLRPTFRISTFISSAFSGQSKSQGQLRFKQWGNELSINGEAEKSNYKGYGYRRKGEFGLFCNRSTIDFILMSGT